MSVLFESSSAINVGLLGFHQYNVCLIIKLMRHSNNCRYDSQPLPFFQVIDCSSGNSKVLEHVNLWDETLTKLEPIRKRLNSMAHCHLLVKA